MIAVFIKLKSAGYCFPTKTKLAASFHLNQGILDTISH